MERLAARAGLLPFPPPSPHRFPATPVRRLAQAWQDHARLPSIPAVIPELSVPATCRVLGARAPFAWSCRPSLARSPRSILPPHSHAGCRGSAQTLPAG